MKPETLILAIIKCKVAAMLGCDRSLLFFVTIWQLVWCVLDQMLDVCWAFVFLRIGRHVVQTPLHVLALAGLTRELLLYGISSLKLCE